MRISIPSPCQEKWENFSPAAGGRFCSSCSKTIIDFTKLGDDEIIAYLAAQSGNVCGRFNQKQLKTYGELAPPRIYPGLGLLRAGVICLLLALISRVSFSAHVPAHVNSEISIDNIKEAKSHHSNMNQTVRGVVTSEEDGMPLPGVNVVLKGAPTIAAFTNAEGRFEIRDLKEGDVLVFSFIGLGTIEYRIKSKQDIIDIKMEMSYDVTGEVLIEPATPPASTPTFWSKLFRRD